MDELRQLEILWIALLQAIGGWLTDPMRLVSLLGNEEFYLLVMPMLYWSVDAVLGARVAAMLLLSNGLNAVFKLAFHSPRPYWYDTRIQALSTETSFGLPSGHSMNAAAIWGLIAATLRARAWKTLLVALILLIGFSRILLGVHFFSDVLAGWALGGLLLLAYLRLEQPVLAWARQRSLGQMIALALASGLVLGGFVLLAAMLLGSWQVPSLWLANAAAAAPEVEIDPLSLDGAFTTAGTWFGMLAGLAWLYHRQGGYHAGGSLVQRILRYLIGVMGVAVLWFGLGQVFPREADILSYTLRFLRYTLVGVWVAALAPLLFARLGLCPEQPRAVPSSITKNTL